VTKEVQFHWRYVPADLYPEHTAVSIAGREARIGAGCVTMYFPFDASPEEYADRQRLTDMVRCVLGGALLLCMVPFQLDEPTKTTVMEDGRRFSEIRILDRGYGHDDTQVELIGRLPHNSSDATGIQNEGVVRGAVLGPSEREALQAVTTLIPLYADDAVLQKLANSLAEAARDPDDEFVHLFEIPEALEAKFGHRRSACDALRFCERRWKRLISLANDRTIRQARHRGKGLTGQRDASPAELQEARDIARDMVRCYVRYLSEVASQSDSGHGLGPTQDGTASI